MLKIFHSKTKNILENAGYHNFSEAGDGNEALDKIKTEKLL